MGGVALTLSGGGRMLAFVAICYRIAGHVKQAAKEVRDAIRDPRCLLRPGVFSCASAGIADPQPDEEDDDQGLEPPHETGA